MLVMRLRDGGMISMMMAKDRSVRLQSTSSQLTVDACAIHGFGSLQAKTLNGASDGQEQVMLVRTGLHSSYS
jgi:hypothetical protein